MSALSGDPWIRYRDTCLYVVPSIHHRVVFAQLVVEACRRRRFDTIAVELPASLAAGSLLADIPALAPSTGMVVRPFGARVSVGLAGSAAADGPIWARQGLTIPITPADSIVTALRCPALLSAHWPGWHPEVAPIDAEYAPCTRPPLRQRLFDDYDVVRRGLRAFTKSWQDVWRACRVPHVDGPREQVMARRLAAFIRQGQAVLFVCGAAHWPAIADLLDQSINPGPGQNCAMSLGGENRSHGPSHLVAIDPGLAWLWGWLDDIPSVVWDFERACQTGTVGSWDKQMSSEQILAAALDTARKQGLNISARRLIKMGRYRHQIMCAAGRWTPELDDHLVHSAAACVHRQFADVLKRTALEYPTPDASPRTHTTFMRTDDGRGVMRVGEDAYLFDVERNAVGSGRRLPMSREQTLTEEERSTLASAKWVYRDWPAEQVLHNRLISRARLLAHRQPRSHAARPFTGDLGLGLAWRQTIRSHTTGVPRLFVRHPKPARTQSQPCDQRCPVVWIFDAGSRITRRFTGFVPQEARSSVGCCFSSFYWLSGSRTLGDTPIDQFSVAYCVSLMRGLMPPAETRNQESVRAMVDSFPASRRAQIAPWDDATLRGLRGCDLAIGCAVKYAVDHVIVVSVPSYSIGPAVEAFARERGVRVIQVSRDEFEPAALARLSRDHNVPAPEHWQAPFAWCARFIPAVDGVSEFAEG